MPELRVAAAEVDPAARAWLWTTLGLTTAAIVAAAVLAPPGAANPIRALTWLLFLGSSVHVASTGWLFTIPEVRTIARARRSRYLGTPALLLAGSALMAATLTPSQLTWLA